jgi:hypothetical protein
MIDKSDAMKAHERWIEDTLKHKPKRKNDGLPVEPWHGLLVLGLILVLLIVIGF